MDVKALAQDSAEKSFDVQAESPSNAGFSFLTTEADRGIIERPLIAPHFDWHKIGDASVVLVSETYSASLYGELYIHLLPLIDGVRTRQEIVDALSDQYEPLKVKTALTNLAAKGYAVSADYTMEAGQAAYWAALGASPRFVEQVLAEKQIAIADDAEGNSERSKERAGLLRSLHDLGIQVTSDTSKAVLTLVPTSDYLDEAHASFNAARIDDGKAWMLLRHRGLLPLAGPVFRGGDEPCWSCLAHRYRGNREIESFLRTVAPDGQPLGLHVNNPVASQAFTAMAVMEVAKWLVFGAKAPIASNVVSFDPMRVTTELHEVHKRPQCFACGDPSLHRADREPQPVRFGSRPKPCRNSGGVRMVAPEETVQRYRRQVSPISGVVTELLRTSEVADNWLHVYWAGSNLALRADSLYLVRTSLRSKSSGKGSTRAQAEASALCEAIERYSGVFHGDEIRQRRRLSEFADGEAIHPNDVQLYSDHQYSDAATINARGSRFNYVPERFDADVEMDWTPVWSVTQERFRHLPTSMLYFSVPSNGLPNYCGPDSNGCAAGNTLEEAVLQGFFELIERDAFACWWYNRVQRPAVDLSSFDDPYLVDAADYYRKFNRELWVLDVTNDFGIPAFVAVSHRTDKEVEDIIFSAGAHFDPKIAALRAVCELNQYLPAVRDVNADSDNYLYDDPDCRNWWQNARLENEAYLLPASNLPPSRASDYAPDDTDDILDDVRRCQSLIEERGLEMLVLDQTRPDIGLPVAKVIVPGMRHFWSRLGPGRLYDVPVDLGWLDRERSESELNPTAVFI